MDDMLGFKGVIVNLVVRQVKRSCRLVAPRRGLFHDPLSAAAA